MLAGSHRNAWPDETGTGGRTNRNTQSPNLAKGKNTEGTMTDEKMLWTQDGHKMGTISKSVT